MEVVKFIRLEYENLKNWMDNPNNAFIDICRFPLVDSPYANPFKITKDIVRDNVIE